MGFYSLWLKKTQHLSNTDNIHPELDSMDTEGLSYKTLRKIQQSERQSPTLTHVDNAFYKELASYLNRLQNRLEKENTPQKQMLLHEELQNITKIAQNIYEHREKKIILAAVSKARGGSPPVKNMVQEEKTFFDNLLQLIFDTRNALFDQKTRVPEKKTSSTKNQLASEKKDVSNQQKQTNQHHESTSKEKETVQQQDSVNKEKETKPDERKKNTHPIIRVLKEMPSFVGTDSKTYHLNKGDILSIPEDMAEMLVKRHVAQKLHQQTK